MDPRLIQSSVGRDSHEYALLQESHNADPVRSQKIMFKSIGRCGQVLRWSDLG